MSCPYYKFENRFFGGDYTCIKDPNETKVMPSDHYYRYCRDYSYDECPIYKHSVSSGPCFITTVLCDILGLDDNDVILNTLRGFRDNVLQKDEKCAEILKVYDVIGPLVVDAIMRDENKKKVALDLYKSSLLPIVEEINNNNYNRAIKHYMYMTLFLVSDYNLRNTYNSLKDNDFGISDFNQAIAGHGRVRQVKRETI